MPFSYSSAPLKRVGTIQFGILSPDEIRSMSVAEIKTHDTFENGVPVEGGLSDPRLGVSDRSMSCKSCSENVVDCPGHFGHIELAQPVFHIGFMRDVLTVLRSVCFSCSRLLVDLRDIRFRHALRIKNAKKRLREIGKICQSRSVCEGGNVVTANTFDSNEETVVLEGWTIPKGHDGCGARQPKFKLEGYKIFADFEEVHGEVVDRKQLLSAEQVLNVLRRISDNDCRAMGLSPTWARPDWMIITVLPVPPPPVRPSILFDSSSRGEDDLTHKLADIVKASNALRHQQQSGAPSHILAEYEALLQFHVTTMVDNNVPGMPEAVQKSGRSIKTISQRLKSKEGRIRGNLMGKRVDFSARTVITPDPNLNLDEVGVPRSIARELTYPEVVTSFNLERMKILVENGPDEYPGARYIIRTDGQQLDPRYMKRAADQHLEAGYVVERHIQDGDFVIFNRQPSLHKMSMMGHKIRILPYSTFRLNLSVTTPYNADFDGDEMNLHVPQTHETRAEVRELMMTPKQIVTPQGNQPVMGIVQDSLLGCRLITKRDAMIERDTLMNILFQLDDFDGSIPAPAILKPRPLWTGKQVMSLILPDVNVERRANGHPDGEKTLISPGDTRVLIERGVLLCGLLDKKSMGTAAGGLVHTIWVERGPEAAKTFLFHTQKVVNTWLLGHGFSIGIGDSVAEDEETREKITLTINKAKADVKELIRLTQRRKLEQQPGRTVIETFENRVNQVLNKATGEAGSSAERSLDELNNFKQTVSAGSKGSSINIAQIIACVGQQNVEGKRIPFGFRGRTLPHFPKDDYGPESRGFVENSYLRGLTPQEFFFHAMGGREGLIDTAVKTAETGYIQRRLVKAMEDVSVRYDGTVRTSTGQILQFLYGEDGLDPVFVEHQRLFTIQYNDRRMQEEFRLNLDDVEFGEGYLDPDVAEDARANPEVRALADEEFEQLLADRALLRRVFPNGDASWPLPVNIERLLWNAQTQFNLDPRRRTDLDPATVITQIRELCERIRPVEGGDPVSTEARDNATMLFKALVRMNFAARRVLEVHRMSREAFEMIIGEVESRYVHAIVDPGEMVGAIAAQSIGEPATQMTLNSVDYTTHMAVLWTSAAGPSGCPADAEIGAFIDDLLERFSGDIEWQADGVTAYLALPAGAALALSPDEDGQLHWTAVEAVTRHPPVNADGTSTLVRVQTALGRSVTVTKGKSLLVERGGKLVEIDGSEVRLGDCVPIVGELPCAAAVCTLDLRTVLSPSDAVFVELPAVPASLSAGQPPLSSSSMGGLIGVAVDRQARCGGPGLATVPPGATLPQELPLDESFGHVLGAYVSHGCAKDDVVHFELVASHSATASLEWLARAGLPYEAAPVGDSRSASHDSLLKRHHVAVHSALFARVLERLCGACGEDARVPAVAAAGPDSFAKGVLAALLRHSSMARCMHGVLLTFRNAKITESVAMLLARFAVVSAVHGVDAQSSPPACTLSISASDLDGLVRDVPDLARTIPTALTVCTGTCAARAIAERRRRVLGNVVLDEIVALADVPSSANFVYDLTVAHTRNMCTMGGFAQRDTFHFAGVSSKNVTLGVPRLKEIINVAVTQRTPGMTVYLSAVSGLSKTEAKERARLVKTELEFATFRDIVARSSIFYDPDPMHTVIKEDAEFVDAFFEMPDEEVQVDKMSPWLLRLELDREAMVDKNLTMAEIAESLYHEFGSDLHCMASDDNAEKLIVRIRVMNDDEEKLMDDENLDTEDDAFLKRIEANVLSDVSLRGIVGVKKVFMRNERLTYAAPDGSIRRDGDEWILDTDGTNLLTVLSHPEVDVERTVSNDVLEIFEVLGIEAARLALMKEIRAVLGFYGLYVNYRHLATLCDMMTVRGYLMAITRHGINRVENGPLLKCSFEETVDVLMDAAAFAETDFLTGVTPNVMLGQLAPVGTGEFDIFLDVDGLRDAIEQTVDQVGFGIGGAALEGADQATPVYSPHGGFVSGSGAEFSPYAGSPTEGAFSPAGGNFSPSSPGYSPVSPGYSPTSPGYSPTSPGYSPTSPGYSPTSPGYSPTSPGYSPASPGYSPTSPSYSPTSPSYSPTSPSYSPTSPSYSPTSPSYSPTSPSYSPTSPSYSPTSPSYSPTSPSYSPTSPKYSPTSPSYSPTSPKYSPTSPSYSPTSPKYSPTSPSYSPTSPKYSPTSPTYSPTSPTYSPTSPTYSPTSPTYSPTSPTYSPTSPTYSPTSPTYSPTSPTYSPTSPTYSPAGDGESPTYSPKVENGHADR